MSKRRSVNKDYCTIWETVRQVPKGRVAAYGDIARLSGLLGQARQVGYALHALPPGSSVPWYRVVNSQGKISLPRSDGHHARQKRLLEKEGVVFRKGRIDLSKFGWLQSFDDGDRRFPHPAKARSADRNSRGT